jgi:hypothetical protein
MCINVQHPVDPNTLPDTVAIEFVYPNTAEISLRGSLEERRALAGATGCSLIEVPADMIKNATESAVTGQGLCTFLNKKSIELLYKKSGRSLEKIRYILHTEPSIPRHDEYGICMQVPIRWYDPGWVSLFTQMVVEISNVLTIPAEKIEIHPGDCRNSFSDIVMAIRKIQEGYDHAFGAVPEILIENRTGQVISTGEEIAQFWDYLTMQDPGMEKSAGIILDVQQLKTVTKNRFTVSFSKIPGECLKGFHIHTLHRPPKASDGIPWSLVFQKIAGLPQDLIINPEIHHNNKVPEVIAFCKEMIMSHQQ